MTWLSRWRLVFAVSLLLTVFGAAAWQTMPRKEDPTMPDRNGIIRAEYRGAEAERVERDVVVPIERELASIDGIAHVGARAYAQFALVDIEILGTVHETAEVWNEVAQALARAEVELPAEASKPLLEHHLSYTESVVLAITGSNDLRELQDAAERLESALLRRPDVADVHIAPDADEYVGVELEEGATRRYGIDRASLVRQLSTRVNAVPGGDLRAGTRTAIVRPNMVHASLGDLATTPIAVADGSLVPLGEIARVRPEVDLGEGRVRYEGAPAVTVGVEPRPNVNAVEFGTGVRETVSQLERQLGPLRVHELVYQPEHIEARIDGLGQDLLSGCALLVGMLVLFMGRRLGIVVGICVPVVTLSTLALYYVGGGVLHQISVASLVIALGMLVDNAMVVAEEMQRRIDLGEANDDAARSSVRALAFPMGSATATTMAAFLPMLLAQSKTADFTRTLPAVVILALVVSYIAALFLVPSVAARLLRPSTRDTGARVSALAARLARFSVERRGLVLGGAIALVVLTAMLGMVLDTQFFPLAGRSEVLVSVELPDGTDFDAVDMATSRVEAALSRHPDVRTVAAFVGRTAPKFFYNLPVPVRTPSRGQLVVVARDPDSVPRVVRAARDYVRRSVPGAQAIVRPLEQGPPVRAPVSVRLYAEDARSLERAVENVRRELRGVPGARDIRDDLGVGTPTIRVDVSDAAAAQVGVSRADVARTLLGATRGVVVGDVRTGDGDTDAVPIVVRSTDREFLRAQYLGSLAVSAPGGRADVPLRQVARDEIEWRRASIARRDGRRLATIDAELEEGASSGGIARRLVRRIGPGVLPAGVTMELGGAREGSDEANAALLAMLPVGVFLLIVILLIEFNSVRKLAIVLATVPLAAVGIIPGLLIGRQPFGFMSLLGAIALAGVVVNNVIMLVDVVGEKQSEGASLADALVQSIELRARPFFLTMATTMAGLVPLAFSSAPLWPPMAWSMISGLAASTVLSVMLVPALYATLFHRDLREGARREARPAMAPARASEEAGPVPRGA